MSEHSDNLCKEDEAARFLGVSIRTLQKWRQVGGGPKFVKLGGVNGRLVRYRRLALEEFSMRDERSNTSQAVA